MFRTTTAGSPAPATAWVMYLSPGPKVSVALSSTSAASTSPRASSTVVCMRRVSESNGFWKPGRSSRTIWHSSSVTTPVMRRRVVCGWSLTMLTLRPTRALTSVDLPTLGRPKTATNPLRNASLISARFRAARTGP